MIRVASSAAEHDGPSPESQWMVVPRMPPATNEARNSRSSWVRVGSRLWSSNATPRADRSMRAWMVFKLPTGGRGRIRSSMSLE